MRYFQSTCADGYTLTSPFIHKSLQIILIELNSNQLHQWIDKLRVTCTFKCQFVLSAYVNDEKLSRRLDETNMPHIIIISLSLALLSVNPSWAATTPPGYRSGRWYHWLPWWICGAVSSRLWMLVWYRYPLYSADFAELLLHCLLFYLDAKLYKYSNCACFADDRRGQKDSVFRVAVPFSWMQFLGYALREFLSNLAQAYTDSFKVYWLIKGTLIDSRFPDWFKVDLIRSWWSSKSPWLQVSTFFQTFNYTEEWIDLKCGGHRSL